MIRSSFVFVLAAVLAIGLNAQTASTSTTTVPRLVRISNTFHPANGLAAAPVESVTLSVYNEQSGGTPLWQETQNVNVDAEGHYTVLMGATQNDGVPLDLFSSSEPRWLGVQFNRPGETEQPRVLMASVPYALKASDAETLGGLPASAYLRAPAAETTEAAGTGTTTTVQSSANGTSQAKPRSITGTASTNSVVKFTDSSGDIGNSIITDNGTYVAVAGQAAMGSGHATQTYGFDLYVNGNNPMALIDAYANPGTASLWLQGRSSTPSNQQLSVNSSGLFSITPGSTGTPAFSIFQNGNLSMGTLSPWAGAKLQVHPGTNENLSIGGPFSATTGVTFHSFNDAISANEGFEFRGSPILFSVGNVGIGTSTPGYTLDVAGTINGRSNGMFAGNVTVGGNLVVDGTFNLTNSSVMTGAAVTGDVSNAGAIGVIGSNSADSGAAIGVQGTSSSSGGAGVLGTNGAMSGGYGLEGLSSAGFGVYGQASEPGGIGIVGYNSSSSGTPAIGVQGGTNSSTGIAGEFYTNNGGTILEGLAGTTTVLTLDSSGNLTITGTLSAQTATANVKDFKIDDPLDPEHKSLYHASIESSEMINVYSGNVFLNRKGEAVVTMPDWFEALNTDFRYQLTTIGRSAHVYIAREIEDNRFKIAGGRPGMKVSWQVTGVRHDRWAQQHPLQVETVKDTLEKPASGR